MTGSSLDIDPGPGPELEAALRALAPSPGGADEPAPPFDAMAGRLDRETGPISWLRSRSTPTRRLILGTFAVGCGLLAALTVARADLIVELSLRVGLELALIGGLGLLALSSSLRPHQRPALPRRLGWLLVAVAVGLPLILALLPMADGAPSEALVGGGASLLPMAFTCFAYGVVIAVPVLLVAWVLDRGEHRGRPRVRIAAVGAGLAGLFGLELHCPVQLQEHLMIGHAPVVLAVLAATLLLSWARRI